MCGTRRQTASNTKGSVTTKVARCIASQVLATTVTTYAFVLARELEGVPKAQNMANLMNQQAA
jgi:hypothetical protein